MLELGSLKGSLQKAKNSLVYSGCLSPVVSRGKSNVNIDGGSRAKVVQTVVLF